MVDSIELQIDRLVVKEAVETVLCRYSNAIDRGDLEMLKSVYWPEATDDHGIFVGNAIAFAEFIIPLLSTMSHTMHRISNVGIELKDKNTAHVQSYFMSYHEHDTSQTIVGGRYLDQFERRAEEWRILKRVVVMDWLPGEMYSKLKHGVRSHDDPFYNLGR
jgi:hypothetical protein